MTDHKQVHIRHKEMEADVDEELADLILNLWKINIFTFLSCQDNVPKGYVWIDFSSASDAEEFLNIIAEYDEDINSVYQNMMGTYISTKSSWKYDIHIMDFGIENIISEDDVYDLFPRKTMGLVPMDEFGFLYFLISYYF